MSGAAWPSVLLGLLAWTVALWRATELAVTAAVDAPRLAERLKRLLARGDRAAAVALCEALPRAWAAQCARAALLEATTPAEWPQLLQEQKSARRARAELGLGALTTFSRMAFPLALGSAIIALSSALGQTAGVSLVQQALGAALQCVTAGLLTTVFCRTSSAMLRTMAGRRLQEIRIVSEAICSK